MPSTARRMTCRTWSFDRNRSWLMMPHPICEASTTRTPRPSMAAFSEAPTRLMPPAIVPASASARSLVAVITVILPASAPMRDGVAMPRIELAQALERQHGSHAVGDDVEAAGVRASEQGIEHALQG